MGKKEKKTMCHVGYVCRYTGDTREPVDLAIYNNVDWQGVDLNRPYSRSDLSVISLNSIKSEVKDRIPFLYVDSRPSVENIVMATKEHAFTMFVEIPSAHPAFSALLAPNSPTPFRTLMLNQGSASTVIPVLLLSDNQAMYVTEYYGDILDKPVEDGPAVCRAGYLEGSFRLCPKKTVQPTEVGSIHNPVGIFARPYWDGTNTIVDYRDDFSVGSAALPNYAMTFRLLDNHALNAWLATVLGDGEPQNIRSAITGPVRDRLMYLMLQRSIEIPTYLEATRLMPRLHLQPMTQYIETVYWVLFQGSDIRLV